MGRRWPRVRRAILRRTEFDPISTAAKVGMWKNHSLHGETMPGHPAVAPRVDNRLGVGNIRRVSEADQAADDAERETDSPEVESGTFVAVSSFAAGLLRDWVSTAIARLNLAPVTLWSSATRGDSCKSPM